MQNYQLEKPLEWRVKVLEHGLSQLGQGVILLTNQGKVMFLTEFAKSIVLKKDGLTLQNDVLTAVIAQDNERLQNMLSLTVSDTSPDIVYNNFYIHRKENLKPYLLFISKFHFNLDSEKNGEGILIIIKDTHANTFYWLERLKSKYRLTNREANFAVLLTEGRNVKEISAVMNIVEETARQYLKNCFKKMEVQKQHELVSLALAQEKDKINTFEFISIDS